MNQPNIFAIIITFNGMQWYDRCFGSLLSSELPVQILALDNASSDESVSYIREHFPSVKLIENHNNLGFAKANNIGIRYALEHNADYVFLLNQDAWIEKNTLTELVRTFEENENVGIASPIHMNGSYSGLDQGFASYMPNDFVSDAYMGKIKQYYSVPFVNAAAWLISRERLSTVGGFDTSLFHHYGEDDNYCQRVIFHRLSILVNTRCSIYHNREYRWEREKEYRNTMLCKTAFIEEKINYGNINNDINIPILIKNRRRKLVRAYLKLSTNRVLFNRSLITTLRQIQESREKNKKGGMVWL